MYKRRRIVARSIKLLFLLLITGLFLNINPFISKAEQNRLAGSDRFATAVEVSKNGWTRSNTVVLTQGLNFPDALAGVPYAYKLNAPILLTQKDILPSVTKKEIIRLRAKNVVILGGSGVVSDSVEDLLKNDLRVSITRIGGKDRFETANLIAKEIGNYQNAILVNGLNFPDALSVASYAAKMGYPILLSEKDRVTDSTSSLLRNVDQIYAVGGPGVLSNTLVRSLGAKRISGSDRYETAANFVKKLDHNVSKIYVATGVNFADALSGAVLAAKKNGAILLVSSSSSSNGTNELLNQMLIDDVIILGGSGVISDRIIAGLNEFINYSVTKGTSNKMVFYSPHPDDELLSMGVGIVYYLNRGFDVHVVLLSKGRESSAYSLLLHDFPELTKEEFGEARVREFIDAVARLGVPLKNVHIYDLPDGSMAKEDVKEIMRSMEKRFPNAHHRAFSFMDIHQDHRQTGVALRELYLQQHVKNAKLYVSALQLDQIPGYYIPLDNPESIMNSIHAYEVLDPANGRYAIGVKSVPSLFSQLNENPRSKVHDIN